MAGGARWKLFTHGQVRRQLVFFKTLSPRYRFHGKVSGAETRAIFGKARASLNPVV